MTASTNSTHVTGRGYDQLLVRLKQGHDLKIAAIEGRKCTTFMIYSGMSMEVIALLC